MLLGEFLKISGAMRNWRKWSSIVAVRLGTSYNIGWIILEKISSIIVFELEVTLVGWVGRNTDEARESKNSLVEECWSCFEMSTLKLPNGKTDFFR